MPDDQSSLIASFEYNGRRFVDIIDMIELFSRASKDPNASLEEAKAFFIAQAVVFSLFQHLTQEPLSKDLKSRIPVNISSSLN